MQGHWTAVPGIVLLLHLGMSRDQVFHSKNKQAHAYLHYLILPLACIKLLAEYFYKVTFILWIKIDLSVECGYSLELTICKLKYCWPKAKFLRHCFSHLKHENVYL